MASMPARSTRIIILAALLVLLAAAGWSLAWLRIADRTRGEVESWVAGRRADGLKVDYTTIAVTGYPLHWRVTVSQPNMAGAGPTEWTWQGYAVEADLSPWSMREVPLRFPGDQRFSVGAGNVSETWTLSAARPNGRIAVDERGRLDHLALDLGDRTLTRTDDVAPTRADHFTADAQLPRGEADHQTAVFDLALTLDNATLGRAPAQVLGTQVAHAELDLSFKGRLPGGPLAKSIAAWRDDGGTIEINKVAVKWGPLDADGNGTLALDEQNRPLGAFTARWRGYDETIDALQATGQLKPFPAAAAKIALRALARQNKDGPDEVQIPLTAQDGRVFVAGIPLIPVPALRFQ
ncbi:MAG: DUF2125 domain-containing protein [Alphaproteobacteria bacterium]|nr:DUF2125 domain-containing protein [Alphaproteobacteria bacterium]